MVRASKAWYVGVTTAFVPHSHVIAVAMEVQMQMLGSHGFGTAEPPERKKRDQTLEKRSIASWLYLQAKTLKAESRNFTLAAPAAWFTVHSARKP